MSGGRAADAHGFELLFEEFWMRLSTHRRRAHGQGAGRHVRWVPQRHLAPHLVGRGRYIVRHVHLARAVAFRDARRTNRQTGGRARSAGWHVRWQMRRHRCHGTALPSGGRLTALSNLVELPLQRRVPYAQLLFVLALEAERFDIELAVPPNLEDVSVGLATEGLDADHVAQKDAALELERR